jgi:hypothetical protein
MPKSDFLIGLESGAGVAGQWVDRRIQKQQADAALELKKKDLELEAQRNQTNAEYMNTLNQLHQQRLSDAVSDRKNEMDGLARISELDRQVTGYIQEHPDGEGFSTFVASIRKNYSDVFNHPSQMVNQRAVGLYTRAKGFLDSSAEGKHLAEVDKLVAEGLLDSSDREDPMKIVKAFNQKDANEMRALAAKGGINPEMDKDVLAAIASAETTKNGSFTAPAKELIKRVILDKATVIARSRKEVEGEVTHAFGEEGKSKVTVPLAELGRKGVQEAIASAMQSGGPQDDVTKGLILGQEDMLKKLLKAQAAKSTEKVDEAELEAGKVDFESWSWGSTITIPQAIDRIRARIEALKKGGGGSAPGQEQASGTGNSATNAPPAAASSGDGRVRMLDPNGKPVRVVAAQVQDAEKQGYRIVQ